MQQNPSGGSNDILLLILVVGSEIGLAYWLQKKILGAPSTDTGGGSTGSGPPADSGGTPVPWTAPPPPPIATGPETYHQTALLKRSDWDFAINTTPRL